MSVSIYAYRTLLWMSDQQQEVIPAGSVPQEILPPDERKATHQEMLQHGWLMDLGKRLSGGPDFALSTEGERQARRWGPRYADYSAAYEILSAIPQEQGGHLSRAQDVFDGSSHDPVLGRAFSDEEIHKGADMLHQQEQILASITFDEPLSHLEITPHGEDVRDEHYVPGLRRGLSTAEGASRTEINTNISGGNFAAAQFGQTNTAHVENVTFAVDQQFRELRELTEVNASPDERGPLLEQIGQLEEAAKREDRAEFEALRNGFLGGFAAKVGDKAVGALMAIGPALWG